LFRFVDYPITLGGASVTSGKTKSPVTFWARATTGTDFAD